MTREIFDYSKSNPNDYEYYGFHIKNGRYHIDTKRLKNFTVMDVFQKNFLLLRETLIILFLSTKIIQTMQSIL